MNDGFKTMEEAKAKAENEKKSSPSARNEKLPGTLSLSSVTLRV